MYYKLAHYATFALFQFSLDSEDRNDKEYLGQILGFKVFVRGVTQVELQYDFPTFEGKGEKVRRDAFTVYFVAAGRNVYPKPRPPIPHADGLRVLRYNQCLSTILTKRKIELLK